MVGALALGCGRLKPAAVMGTMPPAAPVRILDGSALLMGNGTDACTHQTPPSGDGHRWCAFTIGPSAGGLAALWVIDVSRAAAGNVPRCDGSDPGCLLLTDKVVTRTSTHFEGDTLIYSTDSVDPSADFVGRFSAWRPGWPAGRLVTSDRGFTCIGQTHSAAMACFDEPMGTPPWRDSAQVRVGMLDDPAGGPLPASGRFPLRSDSDPPTQAGFSMDGSLFLLANPETIGARPSLRMAPTTGAGQLPLVLDEVDNWKVSNDGRKIYFLRNVDFGQRGDLYVADFPSLANPTLIDSKIEYGYAILGERPTDLALELIKDGEGSSSIELLADRSTTTPKTIFTYDDMLEGAIVSPDLRYTTWLNDPFHGVVYRNRDLAPCSMNEGKTSVYNPAYLDGAALMFWNERHGSELEAVSRDGYFAAPERCLEKQRFAEFVDMYTPVGDRGLVFTDELDMSSHETLKYVAVNRDRTALDPLGPVRVHENVRPPVVLVGPSPPMLVYAADGASGDTTGYYVFGPVPF